jgi:hypothetical protein
LRGFADQARDFNLEKIEGVGDWIVEERPELASPR